MLAAAVDLDDQSLGQGVDHRHADAVQTAGDLVAVAAELAAGMEHGEHHLGGALALVRTRGERVDRDATAVVVDLAAAVGEQRDADAVAVSRHRLVDGVVDDFPDQVVQALQTGGADVHARALAHRVEPFEDLDVLGVVGGGRGGGIGRLRCLPDRGRCGLGGVVRCCFGVVGHSYLDTSGCLADMRKGHAVLGVQRGQPVDVPVFLRGVQPAPTLTSRVGSILPAGCHGVGEPGGGITVGTTLPRAPRCARCARQRPRRAGW